MALETSALQRCISEAYMRNVPSVDKVADTAQEQLNAVRQEITELTAKLSKAQKQRDALKRQVAEDENYFDANGKPCSLESICRKEPAWAANTIRGQRQTVLYFQDCAKSPRARLGQWLTENSERRWESTELEGDKFGVTLSWWDKTEAKYQDAVGDTEDEAIDAALMKVREFGTG